MWKEDGIFGESMKFKEYAENIAKLLIERPETAEFDVVTSRDDEGNGFNFVHYSPSVGFYAKEDKDFSVEEPHNAVCVN